MNLFLNALKCRWESLRSSILHTDSLLAWVDEKVNYLWEAQQRHFIRFPHCGELCRPRSTTHLLETYQGEIDKLKQWITLGMNWLDANIPGYGIRESPNPRNPQGQPLVFPESCFGKGLDRILLLPGRG